jgi:hypothetical protein
VRGRNAIATIASLAALAVPAGAHAAATGGVTPKPPGPRPSTGATGGATYDPQAPAPRPRPARLVAGKAYPPAGAPLAVVRAIRAGNRLQNKPYRYGGGHGSFRSDAYDCSGAVSFALYGGGLLTAPLDSRALMAWGKPGAGKWITVYAHRGHAFAMIAGLRLDTSGTGGRGPRWLTARRSTKGFVARHPAGL